MDGACGLSTGLIYKPGKWTTREEIGSSAGICHALAWVQRRRNSIIRSGVLATIGKMKFDEKHP